MNGATKSHCIFLLLFFIGFRPFLMHASAQPDSVEFVTIAILAKDKAHTLPLYLSCIENQTWPANKTYLYIRTNNNNDNTAQVLRDWIERVGDRYAKIYFDDTDVAQQVQEYTQHEWNCTRLKVMGIIRQESVNWAIENNSHYFVVDCDNFVKPDTLEVMLKTNLPIVAPFLLCSQKLYYSNYHYEIDENGYYAGCSLYYNVFNQSVKGLIEVPVVHCAYFIRYEVLNKIYYDDQSWRYEYVIFSDSARKNNVPQYLDNRKIYGYLTFAETEEEFAQEPFFDEFSFFKQENECVVDPVEKIFTHIYKENVWESRESISGPGSELRVTQRMRQELSALIKRFGIASIADAPCGDLNWMRHVDMGTCRYIGIDIVHDLIEKNRQLFGATKEFRRLNLVENVIEPVDLIICRDMLAHLTYKQIFTVLRNFKQSGSKYLLVTTGRTIQKNVDMKNAGDCRWLNLELTPFNFPKPLELIEEDVPFSAERGKHLGLWLLEDINV